MIDVLIGKSTMRGLSRDEIAEVLATMHPQSAEEREMKRRAQQYVQARDAARREDAAREPELAAVHRTYETAKAIAELRRDALSATLPALANQTVLAAELEKLIASWQDEPAVTAKHADDQIGELKAARAKVLSYASRCSTLADKVVSALGEDHSASREPLDAKQLL